MLDIVPVSKWFESAKYLNLQYFSDFMLDITVEYRGEDGWCFVIYYKNPDWVRSKFYSTAKDCEFALEEFIKKVQEG